MGQSRLENLSITKRDSLVINNEYDKNDVYNETHKDALSDGDVKGKGNGISMGYAIPDTESFSISETGIRTQRMNYSTVIAKESENSKIGGKMDRDGNPDIPKSGRKGLLTINKYNEENQYGADLIDTKENIGQYRG